jgi:hypothetical protein
VRAEQEKASVRAVGARGKVKEGRKDWRSGGDGADGREEAGTGRGVKGKGVRASREVSIKQAGGIRFGIWAKDTPAWAWFVGCAGRVSWMLGGKDLPMRQPRDPKFLRINELEQTKLEPVDVVLFQGCKPGHGHSVWTHPEVTTVVWFNQGLRGEDKLPRGWTLTKKKLSHARAGGVSNAQAIVYVAMQWGARTMQWKQSPDGFANTLQQVVDPTVGGRMCDPPDETKQGENTAAGLVDWKMRRSCWVTVPTVSSKVKWATRKLTSVELGHVMDLPGDKVEGMMTERLDQVLRSSVPGKLMVLVCASLELTLDEDNSEEHGAGGERKRCAEEAGKGQELWDTSQAVDAAGSEKRSKTTGSPLLDSDTNATPSRSKRQSQQGLPSEGVPKRRKEAGSVEEGKCDGSPTQAHAKNEAPQAKDSEAQASTATAKAVKADDTQVPVHLWNDRVFACPSLKRLESLTKEKKEKALDQLRAGFPVIWKRKVERDFIEWFHGSEHRYDDRADIWQAGLQSCVYARRSDWWEWTGGSKIFFWRWPNRYREEARKGVPPYFIGDPPTLMGSQPPYTDEANRLKVKKKVMAVVKKGYIVRSSPGAIRSLMFMFDVPKGTDDLRMVYNGSKSGLNDALWAPWFCLPTIETMTRALMPGYWCADNDYGEQFLNFELHDDLKPYYGVDLSQLLPEELNEVTGMILAAWSRNAMGLKPSPYGSVKGTLRAKRVILGDRKKESNPFHWKEIKTNLPGDDGYKANLPWIQKLRHDGFWATELVQYIDDLRTTAKDRMLAWAASSRIAKVCCWLGLQDAARKRREPSQRPGAWAGATVFTDWTNAYKGVTDERWIKTKSKI